MSSALHFGYLQRKAALKRWKRRWAHLANDKTVYLFEKMPADVCMSCLKLTTCVAYLPRVQLSRVDLSTAKEVVRLENSSVIAVEDGTFKKRHCFNIRSQGRDCYLVGHVGEYERFVLSCASRPAVATRSGRAG